MSEKRIFTLKGMHCAACAAAIERAVKKLPGCEEVYVNLAANELSVPPCEPPSFGSTVLASCGSSIPFVLFCSAIDSKYILPQFLYSVSKHFGQLMFKCDFFPISAS